MTPQDPRSMDKEEIVDSYLKLFTSVAERRERRSPWARFREWRRMRKLRRDLAGVPFERLEALARSGVLSPGDFREICGGRR